MKKIVLFIASFFLFISSAYALPQCPGEWSVRWHLCQGTYTFANGAQYVGEWRDDKNHGQGTLTFTKVLVLAEQLRTVADARGLRI